MTVGDSCAVRKWMVMCFSFPFSLSVNQTFTSRHLHLLFFTFWPCSVACGILDPWPGIWPIPSEVEAQNLNVNGWTSREVPPPLFPPFPPQHTHRHTDRPPFSTFPQPRWLPQWPLYAEASSLHRVTVLGHFPVEHRSCCLGLSWRVSAVVPDSEQE